MTKSYLSTSLREQTARQGRNRCGYCLRTEELMGMPMTVDHIAPSAAGGTDSEENLCLACRRCNEFKGTQTHARDSETGEKVRLFNPRRQKWDEHFQWSGDGTEIIARTACGRATTGTLRMNNPEITVARRLWVSVHAQKRGGQGHSVFSPDRQR